MAHGSTRGIERSLGTMLPMYLTDVTALWFRQFESSSISTWTEISRKTYEAISGSHYEAQECNDIDSGKAVGRRITQEFFNQVQ